MLLAPPVASGAIAYTDRPANARGLWRHVSTSMRLLALSALLLASGSAAAQGPCAEVRILAYAGSAPSYDGTLVELFIADDRGEG